MYRFDDPPVGTRSRNKMQEKAFNIILDVVGIITISAFFASLMYEVLTRSTLTLKDFAVTWLSIYVFAVTLGFKGNLSAHKTNLGKLAIEWVVTCIVGLLLAAIVVV